MHTPDCLIVTPAAGVVESAKQLYILVSCNPSIRSKGVQLPWRGTILVVCDGRQKEVKVQIREDFGMDTSIVPSMRNMQSLPDQPVTPDTSMVPTRTDGASPVKLLSKVVRFPSTKVGSTSEATLEFQNKTYQARQWCLSSFAPTYVKQANGEVYRATYSAFRFTRQFGSLEPGQNIAVHLEFIPRDEGAYSQYWDLESSDKGAVAKSSHKTRIELMGVGDAVRPTHRSKKTKTNGTSEGTLIAVQPQVISKHTTPAHLTAGENTSEGDVSPEEVKTHDGKLNQSPDSKSVQGVVLIHDHLIFSKTKVGCRSTLKIQVQNTSKQTHAVKFLSPQPPFFIRHYQHTIPPNRFIRLPVTFKPSTPGKHQAALIIQTEGQHKLLSKLEGIAESD
ncbi:centrosomal protein of 192 kDa-like [Patiria miniata]|uniref:Uncharacterized protein n=1 Tax=Patiria miniata TaxID=46514 RepID=A0A914BTL2_PATMI|nr:centrosomal protein of 192 kDa-like [Patiria miniata]